MEDTDMGSTRGLDKEFLSTWKKHRRRKVWRVAALALFAVAGIVAVPLSLQEILAKKSYSASIATAAIFMAIALGISFMEIWNHICTFNKPNLQRYIVRIILMVPIYSVDSWLALVLYDEEVSTLIHAMRETYEAYVIYNFVAFILAWLEQEAGFNFTNLPDWLATKPQVGHIWPMNHFLSPWPMGREFIRNVRTGVLNYVILRPTTTFLGLVLYLSGNYEEGNFSPNNGYGYMCAINNFSQCWALYCLVMLYRATKYELDPIKPMAKFVMVKLVVFFSFWQSVLIAILVEAGMFQRWLGTDDKEHSANVAAGMQDYLICVEMLFAAAGHSYAFSASEFEVTAADPATPGRGGNGSSVWSNLTHMLSTEDVREEVYGQVYGQASYGAMRLASLPEESYRALSEGTTSLIGRLKGSHASHNDLLSSAPLVAEGEEMRAGEDLIQSSISADDDDIMPNGR